MPSDVEISGLSVENGDVSFNCLGSAKESMAKTIMQLKEIPNVLNVKAYSLAESVDDAGNTTVTFAVTLNFYSEELLAQQLLQQSGTTEGGAE